MRKVVSFCLGAAVFFCASAVWASADRGTREPTVETAGLSHLMRGLHFLSRGHSSAAVPHLRLALLYDPESPFIHVKLSEAWLRAGEPEKARAVVRAGLARSPENPELNLQAGSFAMAERRYREAITNLEVASTDKHTRSRAGPALVDALLWAGDSKQAMRRAKTLIGEEAADAGLALQIGAAFEDHGELERALEMYVHARTQRPALRVAGISEMRVNDLLGRTADAAESLVQLFTHYPNDALLYVFVYRFFDRAGRGEARAYLREAERLAGDDLPSMILVADGLASEGYVDRAIRYLDRQRTHHGDVQQYLAELEEMRGRPRACVVRASSLEPGARSLQRIARCESKRGRRSAAFNAVGKMARAGLPSDLVVREAAFAASWSGSLGDAREAFRGFVARGDFDAREVALGEATLSDHFGAGIDAIARVEALVRDDETTLRLADLYARYGQLDRAIRLFQGLLDEVPDSPLRLNALGFTLVDANAPEELARAEVLIRRAYRLSLDAGYVTDSLGWLRYQQGALDDAKRLIERALRLDGPEPEVLSHYGDVLRALGDEREARASYQEALELNPNANLRQILERRMKTDSPKGVRSSERQVPD